MNRLFRLAIIAAAMPLAACQQGQDLASTPPPARAKNVILFVGDGMGISTVTAARIYEGQKRGETGEENLLSFEKFPQTALIKTYNTNAQVPDSAGTATAMNAGVKTKIGLIGVSEAATRGDCASGKANPLPLTAEAAKRAGLQVGIVTTTRITHATPAAVFGHSPNRDWESDHDIPAAQRPAGCTDLAAQLVAFPFDVALGGGKGKFMGKSVGGDRLEAAADLPAKWAARTGGSYVQTAAELAADALARLKADGRGYYLMVEGGRIDHGHHAGQAGYALEEAVEFARAIQYAVDNTDPRETLILVTADHSHVMTIAGYPRRGNPILGLVTRGREGEDSSDEPAVASDGQPYSTLSYANGPGAVIGARGAPDTSAKARQQSLVPLPSETHGGEDVALYATGPGSQEVRGVLEQNRIGQIVKRALGLD